MITRYGSGSRVFQAAAAGGILRVAGPVANGRQGARDDGPRDVLARLADPDLRVETTPGPLP